VTQTELTAERVAKNDAIFREANEGIEEAARRYSIGGGIPFLCECAEPRCMEILRLELAEYEAIRATPTYFINAPGHHTAAQGWETVVERRDGYDVVEKVGRAAGVVEALDPRAD
jgi:hypothetical protein